MRKTAITLLAAFMMTACSNKTQSATSTPDAPDSSTVTAGKSGEANEGNRNEAGAQAAIEKIYNIYFNPGGFANEEDEERGFGFMRQFVTEELNNSYCMAESKQESLGEMWLNVDVWIEAQDSEDLELIEVKIKKFTNDKAVADVIFKNFGEKRTVGCVVTYDTQKKAWLVDDLILSGKSLKKMADEYCSE